MWQRPTRRSIAGWRAAARRSFRASRRAPAEVFERIHAAGGIASLAHPVLVAPRRVAAWLRRGRPRRARGVPQRPRRGGDASLPGDGRRLGLAVTGGSDYHGDESHGSGGPGSVSLPRDAFEQLKKRLRFTS